MSRYLITALFVVFVIDSASAQISDRERQALNNTQHEMTTCAVYYGMSAATVARLKITLDSVKPAVLRRVEVPFDIRLDRLHLTIQAAKGWTNSHLYELRARDVGWSTPLPGIHGGGDFLDARKARLDDVLEDIGTKTLRYIYDFGDGWEHTITIERLADPEPGVLYPRLIEVSGRCPPEDCCTTGLRDSASSIEPVLAKTPKLFRTWMLR